MEDDRSPTPQSLARTSSIERESESQKLSSFSDERIASPHSCATSADVDDSVLRLSEVGDVDEALTGRPSSQRHSPTRPYEDTIRSSGGRTQEDRAKLRRWLNERRARQLADYRRERQARVESEAHPFRSTNREEMPVQMVESARMEREKEMIEAREEQARKLAAEAMRMEIPASQPPPPSQKKKKEETERRGPRRKQIAHSPVEDEFEFKTYEEYDRYLDRMMELSSAATSEILNPEPARGSHQAPHSNLRQQPVEEPEMVAYRPQKRKPYTDIVRVQHPEHLRKGPARRPLNREEMFASLRESKGFVPKNPPQHGSAMTSRSFGGATTDRQSAARRPGIPAERQPRKNVKTYAQRLQDLQPRRPLQPANREVTGPLRSRPSQRMGGRPEPYQPRQSSTTSKVPDEDMTSILSDWSVSDDVKRILYGAPSDPTANPLRRTIDEVNSQALDMASEHSESTASYIDWDQIDQLVQNT